MEQWPGNPIASMVVTQSPYNVSIIPSSANPQQQVVGGTIDFSITISYNNTAGIGGQAFFSAELYKISSGGWVVMDLQSKLLVAGASGSASDTLILSLEMTGYSERYAIQMKCGVDNSALIDLPSPILLQATQDSALFGQFKISFVPISIVYCPPGQDMTNSLTQTNTFGTHFSLDFTSDLGWASNDTPNAYSPEYTNNSQMLASINEDDIEISQTSNTTITADNQRAIGRAYWGPLGDLFVIAANLNFSLYGPKPLKQPARTPRKKTTDTSIPNVSYGPDIDGGEQVLIIPAWKLLRPGNDPVASMIPADVRKTILSLDPFITNLDKFFPDSGADLSVAANPYADPSANNRAELIGRWWLDTGVEVNYALGNTYQQSFITAGELTASYASNSLVKSSDSQDSAYLKGVLTGQLNTDLTYQQSSETDNSTITNASCFLIKNQNDYDLDGIAVYYDKIFSTFMFQRLKGGTLWTPPPPQITNIIGFGNINGSIVSWRNIPLAGLPVRLQNSKGVTFETSANINGRYSFYNLIPGVYTLSAGDKKARVTIEKTSSPVNPVAHDLKSVKRIIDVKKSPRWEVAAVLGIKKENIKAVHKKLKEVHDSESLMKILGRDESFLQSLQKEVVFLWEERKSAPGKKVKKAVSKKRK
jgi:hypothetical protein